MTQICLNNDNRKIIMSKTMIYIIARTPTKYTTLIVTIVLDFKVTEVLGYKSQARMSIKS